MAKEKKTQDSTRIGWQPGIDPDVFKNQSEALVAANKWISREINTEFEYNFGNPVASFVTERSNSHFFRLTLSSSEIDQSNNQRKLIYLSESGTVSVGITPFLDDRQRLVGHTFKIADKSRGRFGNITIKFRVDFTKGGIHEQDVSRNISGSLDVVIDKPNGLGVKIGKTQHFAHK